MPQHNWGGVAYRLSKRPSIDECLIKCGAAVDDEAAIKVTVFCWMNNYSVDEITYSAEYLDDEEY